MRSLSGIIEHMTTEPQEAVAELQGVSPLMLEVFEHRQNPYPIYQRFRDQHPQHRSDEGIWTFTRYHDILAVLRDDRFSADPRNATALGSLRDENDDPGFVSQAGGRILLFTDPPDHTRMRTLVNKAFTPRTVEKLRVHIKGIVDGLLDDVAAGGEMDVIDDFAYPLPALVICELMGVPVEDRDKFKGWSSEVAPVLDPVGSQDTLNKAMGTLANFGLYFWQLIEERRKDPRDDFLSALIAAESNEDRLSIEELIGLCVLIFIAGHETTQNLIGNGLLALLRNRDQLELLRDHPAFVKGAVEELLRYDSPVQLTARSPLEDIVVADVTIPKGEEVIVLLGAGNRDPSVFADPDRLDITRQKSQVVSFGGGAHFCLGAGLARLEGEIAFPALLERFPKLELAIDEPKYRPTFTLRGLESLPVRY
jgi:pimeloyl-[acyl-carrier protein] synthase